MKIRSVGLALVVSLATGSALGCSASSPSETGVLDENEIVNVPQTDVERQAIGNCWIYAYSSWIESMHLAATGESFDASQSYFTYWDWFDEIVSGGFEDEVSTGGNWSTANGLAKKYGIMPEASFIALDGIDETSFLQKLALKAINVSLSTGALADREARKDKRLVRQELDRAWQLAPEVRAMLDRVFGDAVTRTFSSPKIPADAAGTSILRADDFMVAYPAGPGKAAEKKSLITAMGEWRSVSYSSDRRAFQQRVQRALHDAQPVIISWFVDFNALENRDNGRRGSFNLTTLEELGPGRQGGHLTVLEDYQATLPDGRLLAAGETLDPENPEDATRLAAALESSARIDFFRVKNSWGSARPDRAFAPGMPGYHDLYLDYLDGPVKKCEELEDGTTDPTNCTSETPLNYVVLPPGY